MSAIDTVMSAIETRFNTQWGSTTPILWPDRQDKAPRTGAWVEPTVVWSMISIIQTKDGDHQMSGRVYLNIFSPVGEGRGPIDRLADTARDIFNATAAVAGVIFYATSPPVFMPQASGQVGGRWIQVAVSTQFIVQETV